jgi:hypothetical protein
MRTVAVLVCLLGIAVSAPVCAQAPAPAPALPIPLPPGAAVQMELDSRDGDLLGMVKGLLAGAATPKTGAGAGAANANPFANFLSDGQLTALLKDIHHLHVVSFKPAPTPAGAAAPADFLAFYETPFEAQGGHRMLYLSEQQVVAVGFDQPRGFAVTAVQPSGIVTVVRADGYPDMTVLGSLLRMFGGMAGGLPATPALPNPPAPAARPAPHTAPKTHAKARRG